MDVLEEEMERIDEYAMDEFGTIYSSDTNDGYPRR